MRHHNGSIDDATPEEWTQSGKRVMQINHMREVINALDEEAVRRVREYCEAKIEAFEKQRREEHMANRGDCDD